MEEANIYQRRGEVYTVEKYVFKFINILLSFSLYHYHSHNWRDIEKILWGALGEEHKFPLMACDINQLQGLIASGRALRQVGIFLCTMSITKWGLTNEKGFLIDSQISLGREVC